MTILYASQLAAAITGAWHDAKRCRYLPGDVGWPRGEDWNKLNRTIGGRLIRGSPLAQPCYPPTLNHTACTDIQDEWVDTQT